MGCSASKEAVKISALSRIDDSLHVMLEHDKKVAAKRGEAPKTSYVPRAPHPALAQRKSERSGIIQATEEDESTVAKKWKLVCNS